MKGPTLVKRTMSRGEVTASLKEGEDTEEVEEVVTGLTSEVEAIRTVDMVVEVVDTKMTTREV